MLKVPKNKMRTTKTTKVVTKKAEPIEEAKEEPKEIIETKEVIKHNCAFCGSDVEEDGAREALLWYCSKCAADKLAGLR